MVVVFSPLILSCCRIKETYPVHRCNSGSDHISLQPIDGDSCLIGSKTTCSPMEEECFQKHSQEQFCFGSSKNEIR